MTRDAPRPAWRGLWLRLLLLVLAAMALELATAQGVEATPEHRESVSIRHDEGVTEVPRNPQRVVVIGEEMLELAWVLDLNVVGLAAGRLGPEGVTPQGTLAPAALEGSFFAESGFAGVSYVGSWTEPSLEAILALQPDLILRTYWGQDGYQALSRIAPTVSFSQTKDDSWRIALREAAMITGAEAKAERVIEELEGLYDDLERELQAADVQARYPKVIVLSPFAGGDTYMYTGDRVANILLELGFDYAYPESATPAPQGWTLISEEAILQIGDDTIIVAVAWDGFAGKEASLELMERSDGLLVRHGLPELSPWTGPIVDRQVATGVVEDILAATR